MSYQRFSAVEMFGIPLDKNDDSIDPRRLMQLMRSYGIEGQNITREPADITPYYSDSAYSYFLSLAHPEGPAVVELLPRSDDSRTFVLEPGSETITPLEIKHIEISDDNPILPLIGRSPRFAGIMCIHELIVMTEYYQ